MTKHDTLSDADHTSLSTSDKGQPVVTYVRVGRGMIKVTKYEKEDKATRQTGQEANGEAASIHSLDSSQPRPPSLKSRASSGPGPKSSSMPAWVSKFKKSKKAKKEPFDAFDRKDRIQISAPIQNLTGSVEGPPSSSHEDDPSYAEKARDMLVPPFQHPAMLTPPSSPIPNHPRPLRAAHSHNDLPTTQPSEMWASIAQLESELVARYGRGAVPQLEALRMRAQQNTSAPLHYETEGQPVYQQIEWEDTRYAEDVPEPGWQATARRAPSVTRVRTRTETFPGRSAAIPPVPPIPRIPDHHTRAFVDDLDVYSRDYSSPIRSSLPSHPAEDPEDGDSDDAAAYLQALGIEPSTPKEAKPKKQADAHNSSYDTRPAPSATLPATYTPEDPPRRVRNVSIIKNPLPEVLEQYTSTRHNLPSSDYITTQRAHSNDILGLVVDPSISSRSASPLNTSSAPDSPATRSQSSRRDLPPRPPPPSTSAPYAPVPLINAPRARTSSRSLNQDLSAQNSSASLSRPSPRPQPSPMSLAVPSPHMLRSAGSNPSTNGSQLALPLVRIRITCPPQRGALRQLPALILLNANARVSFAAATWAQMITYCARNAGVSIARRGGRGVLRISVEERMAELTTPGGGRGVGDEEVGFGLGYYVSVEMTLESEMDYQGNEGSVPIASLSIPLPTTLGEVAIVFRERKDIRRALS